MNNDYGLTFISEDTIKLVIDIMHDRGYDNNRIATIVANIINIDYQLGEVDEED